MVDRARAPHAPHIERIRVRWGDMDTMGHVNNAKYFTYCESARMSYFQAVRMPDYFQDGRYGPALASAQLNFRQQVRYPADLEVETRVVEIVRSSFKMEYEILRAGAAGADDPRDRVADGTGVIVWVDYTTGKSTPLPDGLRAAIEAFEGRT